MLHWPKQPDIPPRRLLAPQLIEFQTVMSTSTPFPQTQANHCERRRANPLTLHRISSDKALILACAPTVNASDTPCPAVSAHMAPMLLIPVSFRGSTSALESVRRERGATCWARPWGCGHVFSAYSQPIAESAWAADSLARLVSHGAPSLVCPVAISF